MGERIHLLSPKKVICCAGSLRFRHSMHTHTSALVPGPDPNPGHLSYNGGNTIVLPPVVGDLLQPIVNIEAEAVRAHVHDRLVRDPLTPVRKVPESRSTAQSTARYWRGHNFSGRIRV